MRQLTTAVILALPCLASAAAAPTGDAELARRFAADVGVLASDAMEGRGLGTKGLEQAAGWIETRLRKLGLQPAFGGSYRQPFPVKVGVSLGSGNRLAAGDEPALTADDWTPLGMASSGAFEGELAFVGYGIEAPALGYQELEGVDLKGKVALVLRYEPQEKDEASPFDGRRPSRWSGLRYKVHRARERGAAAVVFVAGPLQDEGKDKLPALKNDGPESAAGIPVLQVRRSVAERWLGAAGLDLARFQQEVDRDLRPRSKLTGLRVRGQVALTPQETRAANVAAVLPGKGALAEEVVVIGAHYDHLGHGGTGSLKPNVDAIHNGADDNASGTVAVLLAAERLKQSLQREASHRTLVFALFSAEEVGLAGSAHFVAHPPRPLAQVVAMVNLDMVGRLREDQLVVFGTETAPEWKALLGELSSATGITVASRGDGYGPSDQTSFYAAGVPVLHFFTGTHDAYHTPEDDPATLDAAGAARVVQFTVAVGEHLARAGRPQYVRTGGPPPQDADSRGYGAYLGTVPDYRAMSDESGGVLLSDVRAGGPADRAGIKGGDRIVQMAGTRIENLYDMTFALQDHKPGTTIDVVVLRGGERVTVRATLGERGREAAAQPGAASPHGPAGPPAAAPASPHGAAAPEAAKQPGFYDGRPGADFVVGAGKPFSATFEGERHLQDLRQLTFGGENAEAYWSPDGRALIYQATGPQGCDQEFVLDLATGETRRVSTGKGRTTCGYFDWPEADRIVYASTEAAGEACPPPPDRSRGYVWAVYASYDLWEVPAAGGVPKRLTDSPGYDAEATWCHRGGKLVFTSSRDGDLELYEMDEASQVRRLTQAPGYDGGAFYSPDCSEIVWRASRPEGEALAEYRSLLAAGLVKPSAMELFVMKAAGGEPRQVTKNGAANFGPYFHPDGQRIIYSSNVGASPREFDLWMVSREGGEAERITTAQGFDGFPMFSPDGQYLVWASNRADPQSHSTNLFVARWVE